MPTSLPFDEAVLRRRATRHFRPDPVDPALLAHLIALTRRAPSGYNAQPWRVVVVQDPERRRALQQACLGQAQIGEAPAVLVFAASRHPARDIRAIADHNVALGAWPPAYATFIRRYVRLRLGSPWLDPFKRLGAWVTSWFRSAPYTLWGRLDRRAYSVKQTMPAVQTFLLAAAAHGLDTCPMEGIDPHRVRKLVGLDRSWWIPAVVPVGYSADPPGPRTGRLPASQQVFAEHAGRPFLGVDAAEAAFPPSQAATSPAESR